MKVMLLMWSHGRYEGGGADDYAAWSAFENDAQEAGVFVDSGMFEPEQARIVGTELDAAAEDAPEQPIVADGMVAAGYYLLDCASLDEAEAWARRAPLHGRVELRPLVAF
ncbi:YciI family protein [Leifsonia sp. F6_8S_P_1B]|uniref:YciI family protein n=1 Tax=Leifsonia williamsii TaxID=3035919 RepID=A0ABT8KE94_9MICO|nr:YciI family protein [Leifsonia williamsii]MDN4615785.1 YciI family protein [Leifsonia williamsii]